MLKRRTLAERANAGKVKRKSTPPAAVEQNRPVKQKYFRVHNLESGPLDLASLGPLFEAVEDSIGPDFAALFAVRARQNSDHHDLDFAILSMPSNLQCGSLKTFIAKLQDLADRAVEMGLADEE